MLDPSSEVKVQLKIGSFDVVSSGTIISFQNAPMEISFGTPMMLMRLVLVFNDVQETFDIKDMKLIGSNPDPNTLKITLENFSSPLGAYTNEPLKVGTLNGRELYFDFVIQDHKGTDSDSNPNRPHRKVIHYILYTGNPVTLDTTPGTQSGDA